jgi:hypothetical protein
MPTDVRYMMAHAEARSRGAVHFQFCILHLSRTEDAEDTEICVVMAIDAYRCEIHDGSRGGTEPRSCAAFSIFNYFLLHASHFLLRLASFHAGCRHPSRGISVAESIFNFQLFPASRFTLPPSFGVISCRVTRHLVCRGMWLNGGVGAVNRR